MPERLRVRQQLGLLGPSLSNITTSLSSQSVRARKKQRPETTRTRVPLKKPNLIFFLSKVILQTSRMLTDNNRNEHVCPKLFCFFFFFINMNASLLYAKVRKFSLTANVQRSDTLQCKKISCLNVFILLSLRLNSQRKPQRNTNSQSKFMLTNLD